MRFYTLGFILFIGLKVLTAQTTSSTYSTGDIPTSFDAYDATCNGPLTTLTINIPAGDVVTAVDVIYDMTAAADGYMSDQESQIYCQETALDEGGYSTGVGGSAGTYSYNRAGLNIANGTSATGILTFEMRAYRTWDGSVSGCSTADNKVDNNTWTITVHHYTPAPMAFSSINAFQASTANSSIGSTNNELIGIEVVTTGNSSPIDLTQLRINLGGSNDINDIVDINIYYTGNSSTFATTTLFSNVTVPAGTTNWTNATGTQTLTTGSNYFWVSVDLASGATTGNNIDARVRQAVVDGIDRFSNVVQNPAGNRPIIAATPDDVWPGYLIGDIGCPYNNTWTSATQDGGGVPVNNDCNYYSNGGDHIYSFNLTETSDVTIDLCGANTDFDTYLLLYNLSTGDCDSAPLATNDDACGTQSSITQASLPAGSYVVVIEGYSGATGNYDLTIDVSNCPLPMSFVSCTASHDNTDIVSEGAYNQEVLKIEIVTTGELSPIDLNEIVIRTDGTDDYLNDIENVRLWYTGTNNTFSTSNQFGSAQVPQAAGTDISFTGTQVLETGTNYFWLTYNIKTGATDGNFVDAIFQSCEVDNNPETPTVSNPAGNREIKDGCYHTIYLYDQGGNGWEGADITVQVGGVDVLTNETLASGSETSLTFIADDGDVIETFYSNGTNDGENRYTIVNPNGAFILSDGKDNIAPVASVTDTADCISVPNYTPNASTYQTDIDCFIITEDKSGESGSLWYNYMVSLANDFQIEFDVYLGDKDITGLNAGADGLTFALQGECSASGGTGSSMGYGGINNSIAVEFDNYQNSADNNDPADDHIAIVSNGDVNHSSGNNLAGPATIAAGFEDDAWHSVIISWTQATNTFEVYFDGSLATSYTGDIVANIFNNDPIVFWGFTAGTGLYYNRHEICVTTYPSNSSALSDVYCDVCSEQVSVAQGANSYSWTPNDGSIDDATAYNPTFSPETTTEYTVEIEDACGNITRDRFTVHVTLPVDLIEFEANCQTEGIVLDWSTNSETNNKHFIVEKSFDAENFFELTTIKGAGNSNQKLYYSFTDKRDITKPSYYRLVQYDFDGKYQYSDIISKNCDSKDYNIKLYPNPTSNYFEICTDDCSKETLEYKLVNNLGQIIKRGTLEGIKTKVDVKYLTKGIYIIIIQDEINMLSKQHIVIE
jgi:hypothetical protein